MPPKRWLLGRRPKSTQLRARGDAADCSDSSASSPYQPPIVVGMRALEPIQDEAAAADGGVGGSGNDGGGGLNDTFSGGCGSGAGGACRCRDGSADYQAVAYAAGNTVRLNAVRSNLLTMDNSLQPRAACGAAAARTRGVAVAVLDHQRTRKHHKDASVAHSIRIPRTIR